MKKKKSSGGGANWMDTYGDMVTLLLTFFVLLYSMSTISEDKWKAIVQSFNPNSIMVEDVSVVGGHEGPSSDPEDLGMPSVIMEQQQMIEQMLDELFEQLKSYVDSNGLSESIELIRGDGYVFITFNDAVFFAGDSAVLLPL